MTGLPDLRNSLRARLLVGMGIMLVPIVATVAVSLVTSQVMAEAIEDVVAEQTEELSPVSLLLQHLLDAGMPPNDYLITGSEDERVAFERLAREVEGGFERLGGEGVLGSPEERALLADARMEWDRARKVGRELLALPAPQGDPAAARRMKEFDGHLIKATGALRFLYEQVLEEVRGFELRSRAVQARETALLLVVGLLSLVLAGGAAVVLSRSIVVPVRALQDGVTRFAEGDHSFRVGELGRDEFGQLADVMNALAERLEHDPLTAVASRDALQRRLRDEVLRARRFERPFALLMVDVDHFKRVNDQHGHPAGDVALRAVAARIAGGLRSVDTVARYGGEEFALVLPETPRAGAEGVAERLRAAVAVAPIDLGEGLAVPITVSVGVAVFPVDAGDEASLLAAADRALYAAKQGGRNRVVAAPPEEPRPLDAPAAGGGLPA